MDLNTNAFRIVDELTKENQGHRRKSEAARKRGKAGGPARAKALTADERKAIALRANDARWKKTKENGHKKESSVSEKLLRNLLELTQSVENNSASVRRDLAQSGKAQPDEALVTTAAKYNEALKKLAKE